MTDISKEAVENLAKECERVFLIGGSDRGHLAATLRAQAARIAELEAQQQNAAQAMAETHNSWEARCHAIMAALGQDFGGFSTEVPDVGSWYEVNSKRMQARIVELEDDLEGMGAECRRMRREVATARADALREALRVAGEFADEGMDADAVCSALTAMIDKEPTP